MASDASSERDREATPGSGRESTPGDRTDELTGEDLAQVAAVSDDERVYADARRANDRWLGEGLGEVLVIGGLLLFLVPEPATSVVGVLLMVVGLVVWVAAEGD